MLIKLLGVGCRMTVDKIFTREEDLNAAIRGDIVGMNSRRRGSTDCGQRNGGPVGAARIGTGSGLS